MKIYEIDFSPMYPVPSGLIVAAKSKKGALKIAQEVIKHTKPIGIKEVNINEPCVVFYESGNY